ncbi:hypothetical protein DFJ74DRAFT_693885 [Hyaloraphidium curvatum]|nr:hypothetical protein DFJ74DRAFT_693885 [Hyaloraphidium curvatum]
MSSTKPGDAPAAPLSLSQREFLALFPVSPGAGGPLDPIPHDPAAELRESDPLSRSALLDALSPAPLLAFFVRAQLFSRYAARFVRWRGAVMIGLGWALLSVQWVANDGRFTALELAFGTASTASFGAMCLVLYFASHAFVSRLSVPRDMSHHPLAAFARVAQLRRDQPDSILIQHDDTDALCPCAAPACAGGLLARASLLRALEFAARFSLINLYFMSFFLWMPAVTFASFTWTTPWAATICAFGIAAVLELNLGNILAASPQNLAGLQLSLRLHNRACTLAIRDLELRCTALLHEQTGICDVSTDKIATSNELYVVLHDLMVPTWRSRIRLLAFGSPTLWFTYFFTPIWFIAFIALGNCIPFSTIAGVLYHLLLFAIDLANFAASNSHIFVINNLYLSAQAKLLRLRHDADSRAARRETGDHAAIFASFTANSESSLARFLGFPVSPSGARSAVATLLTVAVGLWSVLRGTGVRVTMNTTCGG